MKTRIVSSLSAILALATTLLSPALAETASTETNVITLDTRDATYDSWIQESYPGSTDPAVIGAITDPDRDGIPNSIEMVLGGQAAASTDAALLPTAALTMLDLGNGPVEYFVFAYRRTSRSLVSGCQCVVQHSTSLTAAWSLAEDNVDGVKVQIDASFHGLGIDRVQVYIPHAAHTTFFGRLKVAVP